MTGDKSVTSEKWLDFGRCIHWVRGSRIPFLPDAKWLLNCNQFEYPLVIFVLRMP